MKKTSYLLIALAATGLSACYEVPEFDNCLRPELTTLPLQEGNFAGLSSNYDNGSFGFELSYSPNFDDEVQKFSASRRYNDETKRSELYSNVAGRLQPGVQYYRVYATYDGDYVYGNVIEFTNVWSINMGAVGTLTSYSAQFGATTNMFLPESSVNKGYYKIHWKVSRNESFADYMTVELKNGRTGVSGMLLDSYAITDLQPKTKYYVKACMTYNGETMESDPVEFTTLDLLKLGTVTMTDWDGTQKPYDKGIFYLSVKSQWSSWMVENKRIEYFDGKSYGWDDIPNTGNSKAYAFYSNDYNAKYSEGKGMYYYFQNYKYKDQEILWAQAKADDNGVCNFNLGHRMARVILHLNVAEDYPIASPQVTQLNLSGSTLYTNSYFYLDGGSFSFTGKESLTDDRSFSLAKGKSVDRTLYVFPASKGTATLKMRIHNDINYLSSKAIDIQWESGRTYEITATVSYNGLTIDKIYVHPWNSTNGGNIDILD